MIDATHKVEAFVKTVFALSALVHLHTFVYARTALEKTL